jgi:hypothetical protein
MMHISPFAVLVAMSFLVLVAPPAEADSRARLEALLERSGVHGQRDADGRARRPGRSALKDTGEAGDSLFCLTFSRRDTRKMLGSRKGHSYVCFNFLQNPAEAVGNVLNRHGQQQCLITGFFEEGRNVESDCLILAYCGQVHVAGNCF